MEPKKLPPLKVTVQERRRSNDPREQRGWWEFLEELLQEPEPQPTERKD